MSIDVENAPSSKAVPDEETEQPWQLSALVSKFGGSQKQQQLQTSQHSSQYSSQQDGNDSNSSHTEQKLAAAVAAQSSSADGSTQSGPIAMNNGNSGDNEIQNSQGENEKKDYTVTKASPFINKKISSFLKPSKSKQSPPSESIPPAPQSRPASSPTMK